MSTEKAIVRESLKPNEPDWDPFEVGFLGKKDDCLPIGDIIALAAKSTPAAPDSHVRTCSRCGPWYDNYRNRKTTGLESLDTTPRGGSMLAAIADSYAVVPGNPSGTTPWTGTIDLLSTDVLTNKTMDAVIRHINQRLPKYLVGLLSELNLDPSLEGPLQEFLAERLKQDPQAVRRILNLLCDFALKQRQGESLPSWSEEDLNGIVFRTALRCLQSTFQQTDDPRYRLVQLGLDRGAASNEDLRNLHEEDPDCRGSLQVQAMENLFVKVNKQGKSVKNVLGVRLN